MKAPLQSFGIRMKSPNIVGMAPIMILISLVFAACSSVPKIDGSSKAAFERSHAAMVASLSPGDRMRLALAEATVLAPKHCATQRKASGHDAWIANFLGGESDLSSCRNELNGLTFDNIMAQAYPTRSTSSGGG